MSRGERESRGGPAPFGDHVPFARADLEQCVGDRFDRVARTHAGRPALVTAGGQWTYAALRALCDRVAAAVFARHGGGNLPTAILLNHDAALIATLLAMLRIGRICVPLDPRYPAARSRQILHESGANLLITDGANAGRLAELGLDGDVLNIDDIGGAATTPTPLVHPDDVAFIVYTSGSTGRPKGVYYDHRSLLHNTMRYTNALRIAPQDRLTLFYSCSVIGSIRDLYGALLNGACLCMLDVDRLGAGAIGNWLRTQRVTIYNSVTTLFRHFVADLDDGECFPDVRVVRFGGEAILRSDIAAVARHFPPQCIVYAGYGTSETGTAREIFVDPRAGLRRHTVPAGYPVDDLDVRLLDQSGAAVATGNVGEIYVRSRYIARGYWRRPDLDRGAFQTDPGDPAARGYRTGDLGRMRGDGLLELLGRQDAQVKIRGNRVEIGEIEVALRSLPGVQHAAVVAPRDPRGARYLTAFVVTGSGTEVSAAALRAGLATRLPRHMVPDRLALLAALPLTANGKVDRARLTAAAAEVPAPAAAGKGGRPRDATELTIARIWEHVLNADCIGIDDSFFDFGANSLLAMRMLGKLHDAFDASPSVSELTELATVRELAAWLRSGASERDSSPLYRVRRGRGLAPFFFVPGGTGSDLELAFVYRELAQRLDPRQPFYGLSARQGTLAKVRHASVEELAAAFVSTIRAVQPAGPYLLGGECVGGPVAFEMARQLEHAGEAVDLLVLMDSRLPTRTAQLRTALTRAHTLARRRRRQVAVFLKRLAHHGRIMLRGETRNVTAYVADKARRAQQLGRDELNLRQIKRQGNRHAALVYRYRPRRYGGRVILIAPRDSLGRGRTAGWSRHCLGGVEIREVSGAHRDYLGPDHIDETARALGECLREAAREMEPDAGPRPVESANLWAARCPDTAS